MQQAIAVLDSGVGGLTVAKEIMRQLPQEKILYFGDTARAPYGPRSREEVLRFTRQIVQYLLPFEPKMIVIACNTATAMALKEIRSEVSIPVMGVVYPGARAAIKHSKTGVIGVIGTEGTIRSEAYDQALGLIAPNVDVVSQACPGLVPLVEKGQFDTEEAWSVVRESLSPLKQHSIDCLILGCTHYPFLQDVIQEVMGPQVKLINSAEETAREVSAILYHRGELSQSAEPPVHRYFCSGDTVLFQKIAHHLLGEPIEATSVTWKMKQIV